MTQTRKLFAIRHQIALAALLVAGVTVANQVHAENPAVAALVKQADYWRGKGRNDLATQALRRAKTLDPKSAAVASRLAGPPPAATPAATPTPAPKPVPPRIVAKPVASKPAVARPAVARSATTKPVATKPVATRSVVARPAAPTSVAATPETDVAVATPAPAPVAKPKPAPRQVANSASVKAGKARMAAFNALDNGNLASAEAQFQAVIKGNTHDAEALGGLGLVRLKQSRFADAANLLDQASRFGKPEQWAEGLASARFFAGVAEARELLDNGQVNDAQEEAEGLVRSGYPQPGPAFELLAQVYEKQDRFADAAELYRQASMGGKQDEKRLQLRSIRNRALAAASAGDEMGAQREFQNGLVMDPSDPWIRYEFARFMIGRGRIPEAESLILSLSGSGQPDSLYAAALLDNELGRSSEAARLIEMIPDAQRTSPIRTLAVSLKVDEAIAHAAAMAQSGQQMQALSALQQIGAMQALPVAKRIAVANAVFQLGDALNAVNLAQASLDQGPKNIQEYEALVDLLTRAGRDDIATIALQRAGQFAGNSPEGQRIYSRMAARLTIGQAERAREAGRFADAFDMLQNAWQSSPDNPELLAELSRLYQAGGMAGRAAQTWQLVLARDPRNREALLGLAEAAQAAGDSALSEQAERQVLQQFPQDYEVLMRLGRVEQARGDEGAALRMFKQARAIYAQRAGMRTETASNSAIAAVPAENGNPFRNMPAQSQGQTPQQINPFTLGNGTRVQSAPSSSAYSSSDYGTLVSPQQHTTYAAPRYQQNSYTRPGSSQNGGSGSSGVAPASYRQSGYARSAFTQPGYADDGFSQGVYRQDAYPAAAFRSANYQPATYQQGSYQQEGYPQVIYDQADNQQAYFARANYQPAAYQQAGFQRASFPKPAYAAQSAMAQATNWPTANAAANDSPWGAQSYPASATTSANNPWGGSSAAPGRSYSTDPVMNELQNQIEELSRDKGPSIEASGSFRSRSGEEGLSKLNETKGSVKFSTGLAGGRVYARAEAVSINAGKPSGSGLARFGRNATPEAQGIVDQVESALVAAETQKASGVALSGGFESDVVQVEGGTTPIGMGETKLTFRAAVTPKLSDKVSGKAWVERQSVTDSVVSYAGTRDPVSGQRWGQVMRTGGGAGLSYDDGNGNGLYAEGRYFKYNGENTASNNSVEANLGGYMRAFKGRRSSLTVGVNINYQKYANNQGTFTYGNGGYFSPQSFLSVGIPINYALDTDKLTVRASVTPGFQTYSQDASPIYPTDVAAQAELDALKALDNDVRAQYDDLSKSGFAVNAQGSIYYKVGPGTQVGGEASYNSFGSYTEVRGTLGLRQSFGGGQ